jgi:cytochrome b561
MLKENTRIKWVLFLVSLGCMILVVVSLFFPELPKPADWLQAWTSWVGTVAAIVVGTRVFWNGSEAAREYVLKRKQERIG